MRALVNDPRSKFMQYADVFSKNKFIYQDLELGYVLGGEKVEDEELILQLAQVEFGENLLVLFGEKEPLYINEKVQTLSTGKKWFRLLDLLKKEYPELDFKYDNRFMNIKIEKVIIN